MFDLSKPTIEVSGYLCVRGDTSTFFVPSCGHVLGTEKSHFEELRHQISLVRPSVGLLMWYEKSK